MADTQVDREIRIAVVMYGGGSLAIYMNGIAQELLQLVRATSPNARGQQALTGTARAYRKLAHVLAGTPLDALTEEVLAEPPRVRFLIDILSGTSAGGINAVMLAKALARNADLAPVERLWIDEGAVHALLNDRAGATRRAPYREPVKALFNSDKMYLQLLRALGGLNPGDGPAAGAGGRAESAAGAPRPHTDRGPLVDDLDLVVTGTDLQGRIVDLRLADGMAREREHRHVFEFRLRQQPGGADPRADTDEFTAAFDPLLAFAARTTSSLPAVFEPTRVAEAEPLVGRDRRAAADWPLLFRRVPPREREAVAAHAFADGGYLDNKPFGHAVDRLARVSGGRLVTRKLLYLEPVPQALDPGAPPAPTPDALGNTLDVFSLARYETIRADLERIEARNEVIRAAAHAAGRRAGGPRRPRAAPPQGRPAPRAVAPERRARLAHDARAQGGPARGARGAGGRGARPEHAHPALRRRLRRLPPAAGGHRHRRARRRGGGRRGHPRQQRPARRAAAGGALLARATLRPRPGAGPRARGGVPGALRRGVPAPPRGVPAGQDQPAAEPGRAGGGGPAAPRALERRAGVGGGGVPGRRRAAGAPRLGRGAAGAAARQGRGAARGLRAGGRPERRRPGGRRAGGARGARGAAGTPARRRGCATSCWSCSGPPRPRRGRRPRAPSCGGAAIWWRSWRGR